MRQSARSLLFASLGALAIAAFFDAAKLHGNYQIRFYGVRSVPLEELVFLLWYALWGGLAVVAFAAAVFATFAPRLVGWFERCAAHPREAVLGLSLFVFAYALTFRHAVLLDEPIADDELVYQLSARNLALGRVTGPPPIDPEFLHNQFVVVDAQRWHGKYPVGHSLLLAPFELLGRADLLGPLIAAASLALTYAIGRRFAGDRPALLAALLLACSPHFVWTHATLLSQTSSGLTMLCALYASVRHGETQRDRWLGAMGASLGFGILTRPMPGLLVALVIAGHKIYEAFEAPARSPLRRALREASRWAPAAAVFVAALLLTNYLQSGRPWGSGYAELHASYGAFQNIDGELTNSLGGALVRENVWLFGWPCSLLFLPFAKPRGGRLLWALVGTALAYRAIVPKTVVATTGPIYVTEIVPLLCLASAAGAARVVALLRQLGDARPRERLASVVAASFLVALLGFAPVELRAVHAGALRRDMVSEQLAVLQLSRALVFGEVFVLPEEARTWAYFPPNPWPDLRDEVLFLRLPPGPDGVARARRLWRERFADRAAVVFRPWPGGGAFEPLGG